MSKRMNWRNARLAGKRSVSVLDEKDYRDKDAAARWLSRHDAKPAKRGKTQSKRRETAA